MERLKIGWGEGRKVSQSWEKLFFVFFLFPSLGNAAAAVFMASPDWEVLPAAFCEFSFFGKVYLHRLGDFPRLGTLVGLV